jgi:REP-associated tyrosine transposase
MGTLGDVRKTSHARYSLWYHLAWGTKHRKKIWTEEHSKRRVKVLLQAVAAQYDMEMTSVEVLSDHVHCMVSAPPRIAPARIAQILKSLTTTLLFEKFPWLKSHYWGGEVWVRGCFVRGVGAGLTKALRGDITEGPHTPLLGSGVLHALDTTCAVSLMQIGHTLCPP